MRGLKHRFDRSPVAQIAVSFVLVAGVFRWADPDEPVALWLLRGVLITGGVAAVFLLRRRSVLSALRVDSEELRRAERQLWKGRVPDDPHGRDVMRGLVARRRQEMGARPWALYGFLGILALIPVAYAAAGQWPAALLALLFGTAFACWLFWMRHHTQRRLDHMEKALGRSPDTRAFTHSGNRSG
ncbi:hypothetical protein [Streptomyces sp. N35]|uniref:hypothetical protein n=1 Tax=Streptomyces sp. N35 TaxID=2795730 RepID=UPI0018F2DAF7|nr:hypothetical protein [Streptomyces sp. N35]